MSTISGFISTGGEVKLESKFPFAFLPENDLPRFVNFLVLLLWLHFRMQLRVSEFCSTVAAYTASSTSSPVSVKVFIFLSLCRYSKMISLTNHFKKNFLNWSQLPVAMPQLEEWMEHLSFMFYFWLPFEICPTWLILHEIKFYFKWCRVQICPTLSGNNRGEVLERFSYWRNYSEMQKWYNNNFWHVNLALFCRAILPIGE